MSRVQWPSELPLYPSTYEEELPNPRIEFQPDVGPRKSRSAVSTIGETLASCTWELTGAQVDVLRTFYLTTTKGGTIEIAMPHPQQGRSLNPGDVGAWVVARLDSVSFSHVAADLWEAQVEIRFQL